MWPLPRPPGQPLKPYKRLAHSNCSISQESLCLNIDWLTFAKIGTILGFEKNLSGVRVFAWIAGGSGSERVFYDFLARNKNSELKQTVAGSKTAARNSQNSIRVQKYKRPAFAPRGKIFTLGGFVHPSRGEHSLLFRRLEGRTEDLHPYGRTFAPGGHILPLRAILKTGLRLLTRRWHKAQFVSAEKSTPRCFLKKLASGPAPSF
jgi:hypothetical protein